MTPTQAIALAIVLSSISVFIYFSLMRKHRRGMILYNLLPRPDGYTRSDAKLAVSQYQGIQATVSDLHWAQSRGIGLCNWGWASNSKDLIMLVSEKSVNPANNICGKMGDTVVHQTVGDEARGALWVWSNQEISGNSALWVARYDVKSMR